MLLVKEDLSEQAITEYRQKVKHFKNIQHERFITLVRLLKEEQSLHFIYEYRDVSLKMFLESLSAEQEGKLSREEYIAITSSFRQQVDQVLETLVSGHIRTHLSVNKMACLKN